MPRRAARQTRANKSRAYAIATILTLFRSVTQRSDERRQVPWEEPMLALFVAFLTTTDEQIRDLRPRLSS